MRIISRATIRDFWQQPNHKDAAQPLMAWYEEAKQADWRTPQDIKSQYRSASFTSNNRVVFNIHGNKYRLIVAVNYKFSILYIRFVGTHAQYEKIDASTI